MSTATSNLATKSIRYEGRTVNILLQNENGPCPLIAIGNILSLRGVVRWPSGNVPIATLLNTIIGHLYETEHRTTAEHKEAMMVDAVETLPHLVNGLDVNVRFRHCEDFEFNRAMVVLDLLRIRLVHAWIVDPQDAVLLQAIGSQGYNQLQDVRLMYVIQQTASAQPQPQQPATTEEEENKQANTDAPRPAGESVVEGQVQPTTTVEESQKPVVSQEQQQPQQPILTESQVSAITQFLEFNPSQTTTYGIFLLMSSLGEGELAMFFRNNHYSVITKRGQHLYTLVSDVGYQRQSNAIWERLMDAEGLSVMTDETFCTPSERPMTSTSQYINDFSPVVTAPVAKPVYARPIQQNQYNYNDNANQHTYHPHQQGPPRQSFPVVQGRPQPPIRSPGGKGGAVGKRRGSQTPSDSCAPCVIQ